MDRRWAQLGAAVLAGMVIGSVAWWQAPRFSDSSDTKADEHATTTETNRLDDQLDGAGREEIASADFLAVWDRSQRGTYVVVGFMSREFDGQRQRFEVRTARRGSRALEQSGGTALVTADGELRVCELLPNRPVLCAPPERAPTVEEQRSQAEAWFGTNGEYLIFEGADPNCFLLVSKEPAGIGSRFGQDTYMCFDEETGAMVSYHQATGDRIEVFTALDVRADVTDLDLDPG